jgi:hypothetical protein
MNGTGSKIPELHPRFTGCEPEALLVPNLEL